MATKDGKTEETPRGDEAAETVVEFVGVPPYGREFIRERILTKDDFKAQDPTIDCPTLSWSGNNGWKVSVPSGNADLLAWFNKDPGFKVR